MALYMQNLRKQMPVGMVIQRLHRWRQKRKQYLDQARQTPDEIERERLLQMAEHYGRIVNSEQAKIDACRGSKDPESKACKAEPEEMEDDDDFPDFMAQIKT